MIENISDGTIRWSVNVAAATFEEAPDDECFAVFSLNTYSGDALVTRPYFVHVEVQESYLREETIPPHGCLVDQQISVSVLSVHLEIILL